MPAIINYGYDTAAAARASLREFTPALRAAHRIEPYLDTRTGKRRYSRVLVSRHAHGGDNRVALELAADRAFHERQAEALR